MGQNNCPNNWIDMVTPRGCSQKLEILKSGSAHHKDTFLIRHPVRKFIPYPSIYPSKIVTSPRVSEERNVLQI